MASDNMKKPLSSAEVPLNGVVFNRQTSCHRSRSNFQGPLRAVRLCILAVILPGLIISVPVYLKFRVYDHTVYPFANSDMRLIDNKISTTWCQRQLVRSNTTFNAFLMENQPTVSSKLDQKKMIRELSLSDDMKEYWGFYLLAGSVVTVSTCARAPGASLIVIRGHRHLHECAYIGDDSSEEIDEVLEMIGETNFNPMSKSDEDPSNHNRLLRKLTEDMKFLDSKMEEAAANFSYPSAKSKSDEKMSTKDMIKLLSALEDKRNRKNKHHPTFDNVHKHREADIGDKETDNVHFADPMMELEVKGVPAIPINRTSSEEFQDILKRLEKLGPKGHAVLEQLQHMLNISGQINATEVQSTISPLDILYPIDEIPINETSKARSKRQSAIKEQMSEDFNQDEEETENIAEEQNFQKDGEADHHEVLDENTLIDRSNSEFWSSFSSSEEALLRCEGLILSLPLKPSRNCRNNRRAFKKASHPNAIVYTVPKNGYYFFVFSSENEIETNYIRVMFDLNRVRYNVSEPVAQCNNSTGVCSFPLKFLSDEKVVFEITENNNKAYGRDEYIVVSECEPRTFIYMILVLSVPLLILLFAFQ